MSKSRTFTANIDMLNTMVVLLLGDDFETHRRNFVSLAESKEDGDKMAEVMDEVADEISKADNPNIIGLTVFKKDAGCMPFIFLKEAEVPVLVHELVHATNHIIKFHGLANNVDSDELFAKIMEYLTRVFTATGGWTGKILKG